MTDQEQDSKYDPAKHLASLAAFVSTCQKNNTDAWMERLADRLNGLLGADAVCEYDGKELTIRRQS